MMMRLVPWMSQVRRLAEIGYKAKTPPRGGVFRVSRLALAAYAGILASSSLGSRST
jgi:hypothetical protein